LQLWRLPLLLWSRISALHLSLARSLASAAPWIAQQRTLTQAARIKEKTWKNLNVATAFDFAKICSKYEDGFDFVIFELQIPLGQNMSSQLRFHTALATSCWAPSTFGYTTKLPLYIAHVHSFSWRFWHWRTSLAALRHAMTALNSFLIFFHHQHHSNQLFSMQSNRD
jgi:hypothetical protein